jgi:hypothetical protein
MTRRLVALSAAAALLAWSAVPSFADHPRGGHGGGGGNWNRGGWHGGGGNWNGGGWHGGGGGWHHDGHGGGWGVGPAIGLGLGLGLLGGALATAPYYGGYDYGYGYAPYSGTSAPTVVLVRSLSRVLPCGTRMPRSVATSRSVTSRNVPCASRKLAADLSPAALLPYLWDAAQARSAAVLSGTTTPEENLVRVNADRCANQKGKRPGRPIARLLSERSGILRQSEERSG